MEPLVKSAGVEPGRGDTIFKRPLLQPRCSKARRPAAQRSQAAGTRERLSWPPRTQSIVMRKSWLSPIPTPEPWQRHPGVQGEIPESLQPRVLDSSYPKCLISCPHLSPLVKKSQVQGSLGSISQGAYLQRPTVTPGLRLREELQLLPFNAVLLPFPEHLLCTKHSTHNSQR